MFPGVIYANSNLPEKCMKMILSEKEIAELPDNIYIDRPALEIIENLCFAEFLKRYQLVQKIMIVNVELNDEIIENNQSFVS